MRSILFSIAAWFIFFCAELLFFSVATWRDATTVQITYTPDSVTVLLTAVCYIGIGACQGVCLKVIEALSAEMLPIRRSQWVHLAVLVSFFAYSMMHCALLSKLHILPFPAALPMYAKAGGALLLAMAGLVLAGIIACRIQKSPGVFLTSLCLSGGVFWNIVREGLHSGGFLKGSWMQGDIRAVVVTAAVIGIFLFFCGYSCMPRIVTRLRQGRASCVLLIAFFLAGLAGPRPCHAAPPAHKPNIILIILDTLRIDHLSCYGYHRQTTPHIEAFAKDAVVYTHACPTTTWTLPSTASILTGLYPCGHGAHRVTVGGLANGTIPIRGLSEDRTTLAEVLKKEGYTTAAVVSATFLTRIYGLHQGFDYYDDTIPYAISLMNSCAALSILNMFLPIDDLITSTGHNGQKTARQVNDSALAWLSRSRDSSTPFFLLSHYFDAHHPFFPKRLGMRSVPASIRNRYAGCTNYIELEKKIIDSVISGKKKLLADEKKFLQENYDREIMQLDQDIEDLFSSLKQMNLYDESMIIIVSDHGESFGEHNLMLHGLSLFEDNLRVPLIIKYPLSEQKRGIVEHPVSLAGIVPTILSWLSIPIPDDVQGKPFSLPQEQTILSMVYYSGSALWNLPGILQGDQFSLIAGKHKLIQFGDGTKKLFTPGNDPGETHDRMNTDHAVGEKLAADLAEYVENFTNRAAETRGNQVLDKNMLQNLRDLGYIQ